jgi:stage V sporulation protein G
MEITDVRIVPVDEDKLKAFVSIIFEHCFVVSDIKIIHGASGLFVSMPSKRRRNGTFRDIAHPLNHETRRQIEERILAKYREVMKDAPPQRPLPSPDETADAEAPAEPAAETPGL